MTYLLWSLVLVGAARLLGFLWRQFTGEPQVSIGIGQMVFGAWAGWFLFWGA
jgi:hypothetical protein